MATGKKSTVKSGMINRILMLERKNDQRKKEAGKMTGGYMADRGNDRISYLEKKNNNREEKKANEIWKMFTPVKTAAEQTVTTAQAPEHTPAQNYFDRLYNQAQTTGKELLQNSYNSLIKGKPAQAPTVQMNVPEAQKPATAADVSKSSYDRITANLGLEGYNPQALQGTPTAKNTGAATGTGKTPASANMDAIDKALYGSNRAKRFTSQVPKVEMQKAPATGKSAPAGGEVPMDGARSPMDRTNASGFTDYIQGRTGTKQQGKDYLSSPFGENEKFFRNKAYQAYNDIYTQQAEKQIAAQQAQQKQQMDELNQALEDADPRYFDTPELREYAYQYYSEQKKKKEEEKEKYYSSDGALARKRGEEEYRRTPQGEIRWLYDNSKGLDRINTIIRDNPDIFGKYDLPEYIEWTGLNDVIDEIAPRMGTTRNNGAMKEIDKEIAKYDEKLAQIEEAEKSWSKINELEENRPNNIDASYDTDILNRQSNIIQDLVGYKSAETSIEGISDPLERSYIIANNRDIYKSTALSDMYPECYMTDKQAETFSVYMKAGMRDEAQAYYDALKPYLNEQLTAYHAQKWKEWAHIGSGSEFTAGAASVIMNALGGVSGLYGTITSFLGNEEAKDPNSWYYFPTNMAGVVRGERADALGQRLENLLGDGWYNVGTFLSGVEFSMLDNGFAMLLGGGIGGAQAVSQGTVQLIMSSEATANAMVENLKRGLDPTEAAIMAIGSGGIEALTEKYSLEALLNPNVSNMLGDWKQMAKYVGKNILAEGSEEAASDVLNLVMDKACAVLWDHKTEIEEQADAYMRQMMAENPGYTKEDAQKWYKEGMTQAWSGFWQQVGMDALAGAASGGFMAGGRIGMNSVQNMMAGSNIRQGSRTSNNENENNGVWRKTTENENIEFLANSAAQMREGTNSRKMGEKVLDKLKKGKHISNYELGKLATNLEFESSEEIREATKNAAESEIRKQLVGNGVQTEEADQLKGLVYKAGTQGIESLSKSERKALMGNEMASQIYMEMAEPGKQDVSAVVRDAAKAAKTAGYEATAEARSMLDTVRSIAEGKGGYTLNTSKIGKDSLKDARKEVAVANDSTVNALGGREAIGNAASSVIAYTSDAKNADDAKAGNIVGFENGKVQVQFADGTTQAMNPAFVEMAGANENAQGIVGYMKTMPGVMSDKVATKAMAALDAAGENASGRFAQDVITINLAARMGQQMPGGISMDSETANEIWKTARADFEEAEQKRVANKSKKTVTPGKGTASFGGVQYGTKEWTKKVSGLDESTRRSANAVAEVAKALGHSVEFIYDDSENGVKTNGSYNEDTGVVTVNLAAQRLVWDPETKGWKREENGKLASEGAINPLATVPHEFTHWIQQNSEKGYAQLREFVMNDLAGSGVDVEQLITETIQNYNQFYKDNNINRQMTVDDAIYEIVANSCESLFTSEAFANKLKQQNAGLYGKVRNYVQKLIAKLRTALKGVDSSLHYEAKLLKDVEEMARIWGIAHDEAIDNIAKNIATEPEKIGGKTYSAEQINETTMELNEAKEKPVENFSLQAPVQVRKDGMVAVHNLDERSLLSDLAMKGFPMPSIAVLSDKVAWEDYGPISIFFGENAVDFSDGTVYAGDAYTPAMGNYQATSAEDALEFLRQQKLRNPKAAYSTMDLFNNFIRVQNMDLAREKVNAYRNMDKTERVAEKRRIKAIENSIMDQVAEFLDREENTNRYTRTEDRFNFDVAYGIMLAAEEMNGRENLSQQEKYEILQESLEKAAQENDSTVYDYGKDGNALYDDMLEFIDGASRLASTFIESKPNRILDFGAVNAVVLPNNVQDSTIQALKDAGVENVITYDPSVENARVEALQNVPKSVPNVSFSITQQQIQQEKFTSPLDKGYAEALLKGDMKAAQDYVDDVATDAGYTIHAFHGTGRADRVGTVFRPERATSGPMAFFTDNREIAEGYARDKRDTSIAYDEEYGDYHTQFRYNLNGKDISVSELWNKLDWKSREKIREAAKHINFDDELENIIYDENAKYGPGGFTENEVRFHKGNVIDTLIYVWLDSANLFNREQDFMKVLELAGLNMDKVKWNNPDAREEKVYDTYLKIQNPFDTSEMYTEEFLEGLQNWWDEQDQEEYTKESMDSDFWDKNNVSVDEWIDIAHDDIANNNTHNWTRIPDGVTAYLKEMGYDGIKDEGGKGGGNNHTVWIPFSSEQVKSAETVTYDDNGNVIPPTERFNPEEKDIRYSIQANNYQFHPEFENNIRLFAKDKEAFKNKLGDREIVIGETFKILQDIGIDNKPLVISQGHLDQGLGKNADIKHKITWKELIEIIRKANDPVAIIRSRSKDRQNDSVVIVVDHKINGMPAIVPIRVSTEAKVNGITIDANKMASAHSREDNNMFNLLKDAFETELEGKTPGIYYVNKRKADYLRSEGVQFPSISKNNGLMHKITDNPDFVKQSFENPEETAEVLKEIPSQNNNEKVSHSIISQHPDMDVKVWMDSVPESSLATEAERELLRQYKSLRIAIDLDRERQKNYKKRIAELEAKGDSITKEEKRMLDGLKIRLQNSESTQAQHEAKMERITSDKGFAGMMYAQQQLMNDYVQGKTQDEVIAAVSGMEKAAEALKDEIGRTAAELKALAEEEGVRRVRSRIGTATLDKVAARIRKNYNSTINKQELQSDLARIRLMMESGAEYETVAAEIEDLAGRILEGRRSSEKNQSLENLRGVTLRLGDAALKEIYGSNSNMKEIRKMLAGSGVKIERMKGNGGSLDANWEELVSFVPALDHYNGYDTENALDQAKAVAEFVMNAMDEQRESGKNELAGMMDEVFMNISGELADINMNLPADPSARKQVQGLINYIMDLSERTKMASSKVSELEGKLEAMVAGGKKAASWSRAMKADVQQTIDYFNKTAKMAVDQAKRNRQDAIIQQLKSENVQKMMKANDEWRALIQRDAEARRQAEKNALTRRKMSTVMNRINKLLSAETDQQNIPESYKGLARELLGMFVDNDRGEGGRKLTNANKTTLDNTKRLLDIWEQQDGPYDPGVFTYEGTDDEKAIGMIVADDLSVIRDAMEEWNNQYKGKNKLDTLQQMGKTLERMQEATSEIYHIIQSARTMDLNGRKYQVEEMALKFLDGVKNSKFKGEMTSAVGKKLETIKKLAVTGNITPEYFFKNLKNAGLDEIWNEFKRAENKNGLEIAKAKDKLGEIAEKYGYKNWDQNEKHTVQTLNGTVEMTTEQLMALWATWKREKTIGPEMSQHLTRGGFYVAEDKKGKGLLGRQKENARAHVMDEATMAKVGEMLTKEQKAYVDEMVGYMSNELSELGNEASMRMYGIKKYKESYYFPFKRWSGVGNFSSDKGVTASQTENRAAHKGWTKRRTNMASNALEIGNFTQMVADHAVEMINYNTMAPSIEAMNKMLNWQQQEYPGDGTIIKRNMRTVFGAEYGKANLDYLETLLKDLNGGVAQDPRGSALDKLLSTFKKNAVAGSLSVAAQQPLSYIRAAMEISPKYLAMGLNPATFKGSYQEMMAHSGVAVIKEMGRFDMGYGASAKEYVAPEAMQTKGQKIGSAISDFTTALPELMDRATWTRMWSAVKAEQKALHPEMDVKSDEFLDMVGERFNEVMRRTQVYDSTLVKSSNMRSKSFALKSLTSFMAEPTLSLNVLRDAAQNVREKGGMKKAAMAGATFLLSAIAQAAVKGFFGAGRNPDDKKTRDENFAYRMLYSMISEMNPMGLIPGYSSLVDTLKDGKLTNNATTPIGKLGDIIQTVADTATGGEKFGYRMIEDTAAQLAQLFTGVPAKNIMRDARAMVNFFAPDSTLTEIMGGKAYANRPNSAAVMKYQAIDTLMKEDLIGLVNGWLGDAGYKTTKTAYKERIKEAEDAGDTETAEALRDYTGSTASASEQNTSAYIQEQMKTGKMSSDDARKKIKETYPDRSDESVWWTVDRMEYENQTGNEVKGSSKTYRLWDAMDNNKADEIGKAIDEMVGHGVKKESIKSSITDKYKKEYLEADNNGKRKIRDAVQKAYKKLGYTAADADKIINGWSK